MHRSFTADQIADYFLAHVDEDSGDNITHLKLQKLLYYAQGFHLAIQGEPLFAEPIEAWEHGPVVCHFYPKMKNYGNKPIDRPDDFEIEEYPPEIRELLDLVQKNYGQFSASKLREMTHEEPPWKETPRRQEIPLQSLRDFFGELVEAGRSGKAINGEPVWPTTSLRFQRRNKLMKRLETIRKHVTGRPPMALPDRDPWLDDDED